MEFDLSLKSIGWYLFLRRQFVVTGEGNVSRFADYHGVRVAALPLITEGRFYDPK